MAPADEVAALRSEVAALRRQARYLLAVALAGVAVGAWALARAARPGTARFEVEAQEYRLIGPDGNLRGLWTCPPVGPSMTLLDERGRISVQIRHHEAGGELLVNDSEGRSVFRRP